MDNETKQPTVSNPLEHVVMCDCSGIVKLDVNGKVWDSIVSFVLTHRDDIENNINDYGDLKPVWDFFNRNT